MGFYFYIMYSSCLFAFDNSSKPPSAFTSSLTDKILGSAISVTSLRRAHKKTFAKVFMAVFVFVFVTGQ